MICTDKTGTFTQAEMTVTRVWAGGSPHPVSGVGYAPVGEVEDPAPVRELLRVAGSCCDARLVPPAGLRPWRVLGDTTEGALLVAAAKAGVDLDAAEAATPRVTEFPFDSDRKLMTTVHRGPRRGTTTGGAGHGGHGGVASGGRAGRQAPGGAGLPSRRRVGAVRLVTSPIRRITDTPE
ncbi:hypothetical protein [Streptomyces sp. NPDC048737]|uniref:hypothetical protein n=1 Tax=Streptomyces sp. NPDC048737 TaxID=3155764 RepID=UPI003432F0D9